MTVSDVPEQESTLHPLAVLLDEAVEHAERAVSAAREASREALRCREVIRVLHHQMFVAGREDGE